MTKLIGMFGEQGAGKDSLYFRLNELSVMTRGKTLRNYKFAEALSQGVKLLTGNITYDNREKPIVVNILKDGFQRWLEALGDQYRISISELMDHLEEVMESGWGFPKIGTGHYKASWRNLMEVVGTDLCRACLDEDVWVDQLIDSVDEPGVVTDVRYRNELSNMDAVVGVVNLDQPRFYYSKDHHSRYLGETLNIAATAMHIYGTTTLMDILKEDIEGAGTELLGVIASRYNADTDEVEFEELVWYGYENIHDLLTLSSASVVG